MKDRIRKAVIPAAGLGTRFLPVTRSVPKPLIPVLAIPTVEYAVREAVKVGITEVALVVSPSGAQVSEYFADAPELVRHLESRSYAEESKKQREIASLANVSAIVQNNPLGLGHAIFLAEEWVGDESFAVILPDDLVFGGKSAMEQLIDVRYDLGGQVVGVVETDPGLLHTKGVISGTPKGADIIQIEELVEKPAPGTAPSNLSIIGRYILNPSVFGVLRSAGAGAIGEIQITDAIMSGSPHGVSTWAKKIEGWHFDTGNPIGLLQAALFKAGR